MTTILGEYIEVIRPSLIRLPQKTKIKTRSPVHTRTTIQSKVVEVCVKMLDDKIFGITKGCHVDVLQRYDLNPMAVSKTGWKLDNGQYIWR